MQKTNNSSTGQRLVSIDALRGFDMMWIIGGGKVLVTLANSTGLKIFSLYPPNLNIIGGNFISTI